MGIGVNDVEEESVNIKFFFKFLNIQVLSKKAGQRSTHLTDEGVVDHYQPSGMLRESFTQDEGKSRVVRNTREREFLQRQPF